MSYTLFLSSLDTLREVVGCVVLEYLEAALKPLVDRLARAAPNWAIVKVHGIQKKM